MYMGEYCGVVVHALDFVIRGSWVQNFKSHSVRMPPLDKALKIYTYTIVSLDPGVL